MHSNTKRAILKHLSFGKTLFRVGSYLYCLDSSCVLWRCYDSAFVVDFQPVAYFDFSSSTFVFYY